MVGFAGSQLTGMPGTHRPMVALTVGGTGGHGGPYLVPALSAHFD